jgi:hypothetical protein
MGAIAPRYAPPRLGRQRAGDRAFSNRQTGHRFTRRHVAAQACG